MKYFLQIRVLLMFSLTNLIESSRIPGRTDCSEGYILWPIDSTCHRPFYQGPCGPNQVLIDHQQGPYCQFIANNDESENEGMDDVDVDESSWSLDTVIEQPPVGPRVSLAIWVILSHIIGDATLN